MRRWWKKLVLLVLVLLVVVLGTVQYFFFEMIGVVEGFGWHDEGESWTVTRAGTQLLVGTHVIGSTRPVAMTIRNTGQSELVIPYVARPGSHPWWSFSDQVKAVTDGLTHPADQIATVAVWIQQRFRPGSALFASQRRSADPWIIMSGYGFGQCSDLSYLLAAAARVLSLPARLLDLQSHVLTEVYYDNAWHVYDLTYTYGLRDARGNTPSFAEVVANGGLNRWVNTRRPWFLGGIEERIWKRTPYIIEIDLPPGWDAAPPKLGLLPGESWTVWKTGFKQLFDEPAGGPYLTTTVSTLDLRMGDGQRRLHLPLPIRRAYLIAAAADQPQGVVDVTIGSRRPMQIEGGWKWGAGGKWELLLTDERRVREAINDIAVRLPPALANTTRLRLDLACADWWLVAPDAGLTVFEVNWESGDRADVSLRWQHR